MRVYKAQIGARELELEFFTTEERVLFSFEDSDFPESYAMWISELGVDEQEEYEATYVLDDTSDADPQHFPSFFPAMEALLKQAEEQWDANLERAREEFVLAGE